MSTSEISLLAPGEAVVLIVAKVAGVERAAVHADARLAEDLGFHSLAVAELGLALDDLLAVRTASLREFMSSKTVGGLIEVIDSLADRGLAQPMDMERFRAWEQDYDE